MLRGPFVFLGLEEEEKLLWEIFKLHGAFTSGLYSIVVHSSQRADCEMLLCGLGAPDKMCPAFLCAPLQTTTSHAAGVTEYHENIDDS